MRPEVHFKARRQPLAGSHVKVFKCCADKTHRSYNECASTSVLLGDASLNDDGKLVCDDCGNDTSRLYGRAKQFVSVYESSGIEEVEDVTTWIEATTSL